MLFFPFVFWSIELTYYLILFWCPGILLRVVEVITIKKKKKKKKKSCGSNNLTYVKGGKI